MSSIQKHVGPDHKISIHQNCNGQWEMALISADPKNTFFVSPFNWAVSEDGSAWLFLAGQSFDDDDIIHCVRYDQLPKLFEAARRYALANKRPVLDVTPEQRDLPITVSRVRA